MDDNHFSCFHTACPSALAPESGAMGRRGRWTLIILRIGRYIVTPQSPVKDERICTACKAGNCFSTCEKSISEPAHLNRPLDALWPIQGNVNSKNLSDSESHAGGTRRACSSRLLSNRSRFASLCVRSCAGSGTEQIAICCNIPIALIDLNSATRLHPVNGHVLLFRSFRLQVK